MEAVPAWTAGPAAGHRGDWPAPGRRGGGWHPRARLPRRWRRGRWRRRLWWRREGRAELPSAVGVAPRDDSVGDGGGARGAPRGARIHLHRRRRPPVVHNPARHGGGRLYHRIHGGGRACDRLYGNGWGAERLCPRRDLPRPVPGRFHWRAAGAGRVHRRRASRDAALNVLRDKQHVCAGAGGPEWNPPRMAPGPASE